jgi:RNA polymerase sigma-70 factor, ECF subfamily
VSPLGPAALVVADAACACDSSPAIVARIAAARTSHCLDGDAIRDVNRARSKSFIFRKDSAPVANLVGGETFRLSGSLTRVRVLLGTVVVPMYNPGVQDTRNSAPAPGIGRGAESSRSNSSAALAKTQVGTEREFALVERVCNGEKELFYELVKPYERSVFFAAQSIVQNEADAEDVAQEAFLKALRYLNSFRGESKFSTWLVQIAVNEARMRVRKQRGNLYDSIDEPDENESGDFLPKDFADWREIPSEWLHNKQLRQALQRAIAGLRPKYREVIVLRDVDQLSIAETAQALAISEASVKTRLLRARLQVREALAPGLHGGWSFAEGNWRKVRPW